MIILGLSGAAFAQENRILSIRLLEKLNPTDLKIQSPAGKGVWNEIKLSRGQLWVNGKAQKTASWGSQDSNLKIHVQNLTRIYPGKIILKIKQEKEGLKLFILNRVSMENYAACALAFESDFDQTQPEYLKALGAVIGFYAVSHLHRHPDYDLCDLTHCQVYQGMPPNFDFWSKMISASRVLSSSHNFELGSFYFHRCCGGILESAEQIWGGPKSRARTGPDEWNGKPLCQDDGFYQWTSSTGVENVEETLKTMAQIPPLARLETFEIIAKTTNGRNKTLRSIFMLPNRKTREIRENVPRFISEFGKHFGWRIFPSNWFEIQKEGNLFKFSGHGLGHGVGLCQTGALKLAQMGWTWEEILNFYFPGT